MTTCKAHR